MSPMSLQNRSTETRTERKRTTADAAMDLRHVVNGWPLQQAANHAAPHGGGGRHPSSSVGRTRDGGGNALRPQANGGEDDVPPPANGAALSAPYPSIRASAWPKMRTDDRSAKQEGCGADVSGGPPDDSAISGPTHAAAPFAYLRYGERDCGVPWRPPDHVWAKQYNRGDHHLSQRRPAWWRHGCAFEATLHTQSAHRAEATTDAGGSSKKSAHSFYLISGPDGVKLKGENGARNKNMAGSPPSWPTKRGPAPLHPAVRFRAPTLPPAVVPPPRRSLSIASYSHLDRPRSAPYTGPSAELIESTAQRAATPDSRGISEPAHLASTPATPMDPRTLTSDRRDDRVRVGIPSPYGSGPTPPSAPPAQPPPPPPSTGVQLAAPYARAPTGRTSIPPIDALVASIPRRYSVPIPAPSTAVEPPAAARMTGMRYAPADMQLALTGGPPAPVGSQLVPVSAHLGLVGSPLVPLRGESTQVGGSQLAAAGPQEPHRMAADPQQAPTGPHIVPAGSHFAPARASLPPSSIRMTLLGAIPAPAGALHTPVDARSAPANIPSAVMAPGPVPLQMHPEQIAGPSGTLTEPHGTPGEARGLLGGPSSTQSTHFSQQSVPPLVAPSGPSVGRPFGPQNAHYPALGAPPGNTGSVVPGTTIGRGLPTGASFDGRSADGSLPGSTPAPGSLSEPVRGTPLVSRHGTSSESPYSNSSRTPTGTPTGTPRGTPVLGPRRVTPTGPTVPIAGPSTEPTQAADAQASPQDRILIVESTLSHRAPINAATRQYACEKCGRSFYRRSDYVRHFQIHLGIKPNTCPVCGKAFIQRSALSVHVRVHTGEKPYNCGVCGRQFSDSSSLARHRRIHARQQDKDKRDGRSKPGESPAPATRKR